MAMSSTTKIAIAVGAVAVTGGVAYYFVSEAKKKKAAEAKIAEDKSAALLLSANMKAQSMTPTINAETRSVPTKNSAETKIAETRSAPPKNIAETKAAPPKDEPARASSSASRIMLAPDLQRKASAAKAASLLVDELPFSAISSFVLPKGTYSWSDGPTFNVKKLLLTNHSGHSVQMNTPQGPFTLEDDAVYYLPLDTATHIPNPN